MIEEFKVPFGQTKQNSIAGYNSIFADSNNLLNTKFTVWGQNMTVSDEARAAAKKKKKNKKMKKKMVHNNRLMGVDLLGMNSVGAGAGGW